MLGHIHDAYVADIRTTDRTWEAIWAHVAIDEVLKGQPALRSDFLEVAMGTAAGWELARDNIPNEEFVLFLMNEASYRDRYGQDPIDPETETYMYWAPNDQAVFREVDGKMQPANAQRMRDEYGDNRFPLGLAGDSFNGVVDRVRATSAADQTGS